MKKRNGIELASPGRLSVMRLSLVAAMAMMASAEAGAVACVSANNAAPLSGGTGCYTWTGGDFSVTNSGTIVTGGSTAALTATGGGAMINDGVISYTGTGALAGFQNNGTVASINNSAGAVIRSSSGSGIANPGSIGTLTNSGAINASANGIGNTGSIQLLNNTGSGSIVSTGGHGVDNSGSITALVNSGYISGLGTGLNNSGSIGSLTNSGTISSGISNTGTITALTNSGLISSGSGALIYDAHSSVGSLANTGTIAGDISNLTTQALTITGGSGATFGTLTGSSGGIGSADIGQINNTTSNLVFSSGNQLLNDNINATGHTVNNTGATLQLNNRITITGTYQQNAAATLAIGVGAGAQSAGVTGDTGYGRLIVTGNTTIDSGSHITLKPLGYNFAAGQRFLVVQTSGTATYNASTLNYAATGFNGTVTGSVDTSGGFNSLVLSLSAASSGSGSGGSSTPSRPGYANNGNAISVLNGLFNYGGVNAQLLNVFNPALAINDTASANRAGAQLNPTAVQQAAARGTDAANNAVLNVTSSHLDGLRLAQAGGSGIATGERSLDPALWGQFFGGGATQDERDGVSGYHSNYRGLLMGGDVQATESWRAGGLFSYAKTNVGNDGNNTGSSASINSYGLTAYAGYDGKPWYVNVMAGLAQQQYSTVRAVGFTGFNGVANGSFNGLQSTASVQAGYPLALSADTTLTPLAGLTYSKLRQNGYTESGGNGAALTVQAATTTSFKSDLGAKLERKLDTSYGELTPYVQLRWSHEFQNSRLNTAASFAADPSGATSFTTVGATPVRNTGVMVLGATLARSKNLSLSANYTLEAGQGYHSQTADVRLRWQY